MCRYYTAATYCLWQYGVISQIEGFYSSACVTLYSLPTLSFPRPSVLPWHHPVDKMSVKEVVLLFLSFPDRPFLKEMGPEAKGKRPKREGCSVMKDLWEFFSTGPSRNLVPLTPQVL